MTAEFKPAVRRRDGVVGRMLERQDVENSKRREECDGNCGVPAAHTGGNGQTRMLTMGESEGAL